jgi:hypothetical protein
VLAYDEVGVIAFALFGLPYAVALAAHRRLTASPVAG